jgi:ankyrin repeat protein
MKNIFNYIKNNEFDIIYNLIKEKKLKNFDFRDDNYNYFIQLLINNNQINILQLIFDIQNNIRLDMLDIDGRTILYNCIRYNYILILKLLLDYNNKNIGISILEIKDKLGFTALHYTIILNNFDIFKILLEYKANPYIISNEGFNAFIYCLIYNRNNMLNYLLENKYNFNFLTKNKDTILQLALIYNNTFIINTFINNNVEKIDLNNSNEYGLTILLTSIIYDNYDLYINLLKKNINVNIADYDGNTALHYIFLYKRFKYINNIINFKLNYNISNINGNIPLHILLNIDNIENEIDYKIFKNIILESDLNIINDKGITCFLLMIDKKLISVFRNILIIKPLLFYINDNVKLDDYILDILKESYYYILINNQNKLTLEWEINCLKDINECKKKIENAIIKDKQTIPTILNINLYKDNGILTNYCFYIGIPIDILFGLLFLYENFNDLGLILDYPLLYNDGLDLFYKKKNINYNINFLNIEIKWINQNLLFPSYFDNIIFNKIKNSKYIIIPIGIEMSNGSHANILFWDINNKTIERFEPNGANYPIDFNYNPSLLDILLQNKFKTFDINIIYINPKQFLPYIGFQKLENLEIKCIKLGDPNGFCGIWCTWWVYQRMLNINVNLYNLADELIKIIKYDNINFKTLIRNFAKKITNKRDIFLNKYNLDINDFINNNYDINILIHMEKDILEILKKLQ